jgi:Ca2+-binding EF-hand superfamily protein
MLKGVLGDNVTDKMVEKTFSEIDQDGSGNLDFAEVLTVSAHLNRNIVQ